MAVQLNPNTTSNLAQTPDNNTKGLTPEQVSAFNNTFDIDGDGTLSQDEQSGLDMFIKDMDANKDGTVDATEYQGGKDKLTPDSAKNYVTTAATKNNEQNNINYSYGQGNTPNLDRLDDFCDDHSTATGKNNNGNVARDLKEKLIGKFDKDGDGKLTGKERAAADKYLATKDDDGKGFGEDDVLHAQRDVTNLDENSVKGFYQQVEKDIEKGNNTGSGGTGDPKDPYSLLSGFSDFDMNTILDSLPPELRGFLEPYLPKSNK